MKFRSFLTAFAVLIASGWPIRAQGPRPEKFARPIEAAGLPNFHQVAPGLYRSAQPWKEGFAAAEKMGIRTVISLREDGGDEELAADTKLKLIRVPMGLATVNEEAIAQVLSLLRQKEHGPFLVHCQMGADRTGVVMAMWRVLVEGWNRADAVAEMKATGLGIEHFANYVAAGEFTRLREKSEKTSKERR